ncbi:MAG: hypothetical protein RLN87_09270 [Parasphingopyxis sp.]|uniref:hypothetical protein n=1 Tax=Parasphingopyxis sp. TaxID=1920299 RepID=UPI0032EC1862
MSAAVRERADHFILTHHIYGAPVFDPHGHKLATLKGLVIDWPTKTACFAVLSTDGFLGAGKDCRPVPLDLLKPNGPGPGYVTDIEAARLAEGPCFGDSEGPGREAQFWAAVRDYYSVSESPEEYSVRHLPEIPA